MQNVNLAAGEKPMKKVLFFMVMLVALSSCSNGSSKSQESANTEISVNKEEINKAKESLKYEAETANKLIAGKRIDPMTRAVSVDFDGTNLISTYEIDEEYTSIDQMRSNQEAMEKNIRNTLDNTPQFIGSKESLMKINGKVIYNYVGSESKKVLTITIGF